MATEGDRKPLPPGLYDLPITRALASNLATMAPELQSIGELDPHSAPHLLARVLHPRIVRALAAVRAEPADKLARQLALANLLRFTVHLVPALLLQRGPSRSTVGGDPSDRRPEPPEMSALTSSTLGPLGLCLVSACIGCGGDDTTEPPPQCAVEVVLTGGYEVSATGTSCNGGSQMDANAFTLGIDIPDASAASVRLRLFGVQLGSGAKGMGFPAGVLLSNPPTETWQAGMDDGSACTAVVDDDFEERPGESNLRVLKAHVESCSKTLLSEQPGQDPVTVVRLRGAARYVPQ